MKIGLLIFILLISVLFSVFTYTSVLNGDWIFSPLLVLGSWGVSIGTWYIIRSRVFGFTKILFKLQKLSLIHLVISFKIIPDENFFIGKERSSVTTLFFMFIGGWAISTALAKSLMELTSYPDTFTNPNGFTVITMMASWLFIPLTMYLLFAILTLDSSNLRVLIKEKKIVTSASAPFRVLIGGFGTIHVLLNTLLELRDASTLGIFFLPLLTATPFIWIIFLYHYKSKELLNDEFQNYLNEIGIKTKEIKLE